jgi:glycosyltransferase involved in cell wall biosynthesis
MTHYNNISTVRRSLNSVLEQIDGRFEIVIVDNFSNDGSYEILSEYAAKNQIKLIQSRCSRGRGRQIAFENSFGDYVISGMDLDDIFKPFLIPAVKSYHETCEGKLLQFRQRTVSIAPRKLIVQLGGWRDVNYGEDADLFLRAKNAGMKVPDVLEPIAIEIGTHELPVIRRYLYHLHNYSEQFRVGLLPPWRSWFNPRNLIVFAPALLVAFARGSPKYSLEIHHLDSEG